MSAKPPRPLRDGDTLDYRAVRRRFNALNLSRLMRVKERLRSRQRLFFDLVPLLFHVNHPLLPGYVSKETPAGIFDFQPGKTETEAARQVAKGFQHKRRALLRHSIDALYVMGSVGTIAYSDKSDFDFWLCYPSSLGIEELEELARKARLIEEWAASMEVEVHFFLMDADAFRRGDRARLTVDSSGSAQHHLLLDEFYRTGLLLAGKYPAWWLVPPEFEREYDDYIARVLHQRFVDPREVVDFGGMAEIPAGEFIGAALWQLFKGIDSPYKSVLKILVMEAYASEHPHIDLLSQRFKRAVYDGETQLDRLDPYLMMYQKVAEYLAGEQRRLELARHCFYFKVELPLSKRNRVDDWRYELLRAITREWNWSDATLHLLDARPGWKLLQVLKERRSLVDELSHSYRVLSGLIREHADDTPIAAADLHVLGRKLYAAFERKAGKVELVNPGISGDLREKHLTLQENVDERGRGAWSLYLDQASGETAEEPVRRASGLLELLAWCHFNRITDNGTNFSLHTERSSLSELELRGMLDRLNRVFPRGRLPSANIEALSRPALVEQSLLFVNVGFDPMARLLMHGIHLTTGRLDALSFGAMWENLALSFDQLLVNNWQEVLTFRSAGTTAVLDCLCKYLAHTPLSLGIRPTPVSVACLSSTRGITIAGRIEELFADVIDCYYGGQHPANSRYVVRIGNGYHLLQVENDLLRHSPAGNLEGLQRLLSAPQAHFSPVVVDRHALSESPLALLLAHNHEHRVQLAYFVQHEEADVYVLDEKGSLFHQRVPFHDAASLLSQYQWFFDAVLPRRSFLATGSHDTRYQNEVELSQVVRDPATGHFSLEARKVPRRLSRRYFNVQVIGDKVADRSVYTIYCDDLEFSTLEHGEALFDVVAAHLLARRASGEHYPIYITDIDISKTLLNDDVVGELQTIHYLNYKRRVEEHLNQALERA